MEFPSTIEKEILFNLYTNLYCQRQTGDIHLDKMRVQHGVHKQSSQRHSVCGSQICAFFFVFYIRKRSIEKVNHWETYIST